MKRAHSGIRAYDLVSPLSTPWMINQSRSQGKKKRKKRSITFVSLFKNSTPKHWIKSATTLKAGYEVDRRSVTETYLTLSAVLSRTLTFTVA